nr:M23 family metallopeptidase [uncultured Tyzzerella sp.]
MSANINKGNFSKTSSANKDNIIEFPLKNNNLKLKETNIVISNLNLINDDKKQEKEKQEKENSLLKHKNNIINKFYSVKDKETKLSSQKSNIININGTDNNDNGNNKLPPKPVAVTVLGVVLTCVVVWALTHKNAQEVYVGDKMVAIIKPTSEDNIESPEQLKELALSDLSEKTGSKVEVNEEVIFKPVRASKDEITPISDASAKVAENFTFKVEASVITVDGQPIATVKNKEEANKILNDIKNKYVNKDAKQVAQPTFVQDVKIEDKYVAEDDIIENSEALKALTANKDQGKQHEIKEGDTLFELAMKNDMSLDELLQANPQLTETSVLKIGSKVNLIVPVPLLSVVTYEEAVYTEPIPKKIETVKNDKEFKTYKKVITPGKDGSKQVTAKITKINGVEDKKEVISEKVISEPTVEKVEVGTLNTPPKKAIGNFIYPVRGRLTSGYGARWGTTHKGLDLAAPAGTPIKASDGGTVVYSGWNSGGYGNMVKIDHGNGYQTIYAHNSRNAVSVGQKVAQGEVIAYVGSTGNSTGNHVHFEVIQNGSSKNPLNFLK